MRHKFLKFLFVFFAAFLVAIGGCNSDKHPFGYDLHLNILPGKKSKAILCFHGFGGDYRIAERIKAHGELKETLISFNFPDYGIRESRFDPEKTSFGTIDELLPALYVMKKYLIEENMRPKLYGFSAGGGALLNCIAVLNSERYDAELARIGIGKREREEMLNAVQQCVIVLDTPLKSIDELIAYQSPTPALEIISARYRQNGFNPMESLEYLQNLSLHIIVHFQFPDEVLSNRDDSAFVQKLKEYNGSGVTEVIIGCDGGHNAPHSSLWSYLK